MAMPSRKKKGSKSVNLSCATGSETQEAVCIAYELSLAARLRYFVWYEQYDGTPTDCSHLREIGFEK